MGWGQVKERKLEKVLGSLKGTQDGGQCFKAAMDREERSVLRS
jgi:hypothetical protein